MTAQAMMRAVQAHGREPADLAYETVDRPVPGSGDALVAVHAAAITADELTWPDATPFIPAHDVSGVVVELAADASDRAVGDEVYGLIAFDRPGAAAELVAVSAAELAAKPSSVDHATSAAVPLAGLTAWQALFDHARLEKGQRVLIHGGAGGVGTYAVQLAALHGATVTATASAASAEFVAALGASHVIDYRTAFEEQVSDVDVVIDMVGGDALARSWGVLRRGGILVAIAEEPPTGEAEAHGVRSRYFVVEPNRRQLEGLARLVDNGQLRPFVGMTLPLAEAAAAFTAQRDAHVRGKIVLGVAAAAMAT